MNRNMYARLRFGLQVLRRLEAPSTLPGVNCGCRCLSLSARRMDELKKNPYFDKYAGKINKLQESAPEELDSKLKELAAEKERTRQHAIEDAKAQKADLQEQASQLKKQGLDGIVKLDLLKDRSPEEIEEIWKEYHLKKDCIFAVIPKDEYIDLFKRGKQFPMFLYPLPRGEGYEFFLQQMDGTDISLTPLVMYQAHGENAPASLTLNHYTELMEDKGIVLMSATPDTNILSVHEAQLLSLQIKMYYGLNSGIKFNLVRMFNTDPTGFNHFDLIKEFQNYIKDSRDFRENLKYKTEGTPV